MNCPQCQELLDERLDELRPGLRNGTLSPDDARSQAQKALADAVSQCAECESELRGHLALRLSLMMPDAEIGAVTVPPALRANVRRALERESASRPYATSAPSAWKPLKGLVWTSGAVFSAIVLFVIARPFLMERAQQSYSAPSSGMATAHAPGATDSDSTAPKSSVPSLAPKSRPGKPPVGTAGALPAKPIIPPPLPAKAPAVPPPPTVVPSGGAGGTTGQAAPPPAPIVRQSAPSTQSGGTAPDRKNSAIAQAKTPGGKQSSPTLSQPPRPIVRSSGPSSVAPPQNSGVPAEPRLAPGLLAPSGKDLGLAVSFVPARGELRNSAMSSAAVAPPAPIAPPQDSPPMVGSAAPAPKPQPQGGGATEPAAPGAVAPLPPPRAMRSRVAPDNRGGVGAPPDVSTGNADSRGEADTDGTPNKTPVAGNLSVSVNEAVTNARVVGQVEGREGKGVLLWSGNAPAHKPISVPLEPLKANKGDTINVSFQQQVSLGETKTLATTSVVVP